MRRSSRFFKSTASTIEDETPAAGNSDLISDTDFDADRVHEDAFIDQPSARKKQKSKGSSLIVKETKAGRKVCGKRGVLRDFAEMPLDILFEIFSRLGPLDLVNLTRTTKPLRKLLLEKSATCVWKDAHGNVPGMPGCLEDMSEQAYICLVLESHCQRFLGRTAHICWEFRLRICNKCLMADGRFINNTYMYQSGVVMQCCPTVEMPFNESGRRRYTSRYFDDTYLKKNYHSYIALDDKQKEQWAKTERETKNKVREHAQKCVRWLESRAEERANMMDGIRIRRVDEIVKRLTDIGWGEVIDNLPPTERIQVHPLVYQKKELTERIWNNIRPGLLEFLEEQKELCFERLQRARVEARIPILLKFYEKLASAKLINATIPPLTALFLFEPIQNLIVNTPTAVELEVDDLLQESAVGLDEFCDQWRREMDLKLLRMNIEETLSKATVAFKCRFCYGQNNNNYIRYPRILMHQHAKIPHAFSIDSRYPVNMKKAFDKLAGTQEMVYYRAGATIEFDRNYAVAACAIVSACGLDSESASIADMDRLDPFLECAKCKPGVEWTIRTWRASISHMVSHIEKNEDDVGCKLVTDQIMVKKLKDWRHEVFLKGPEYRRFGDAPVLRFVCMVCRFRDMARGMKEHFLIKHDKTDINPGDVVRHIDEDDDCFEYAFPVDFLGLFEH
ncbi:hypothetical protein BDQ17DRAFT_1371125 [Cyathus striatus]|nr:hypothetical protein BDQ17DRAFT_1371125 [Cyathus striatus]